MKDSVKGRDQFKVNTLRMVISAIKNREIESRGELDDQSIWSLLSTLVKQRREAADLYRKGGRDELAEKEENEITLLKNYLPEEMSEAEIVGIIRAVIDETGASSLGDMGRVMKEVMSKIAGRAEGRLVSDLVKKCLAE